MRKNRVWHHFLSIIGAPTIMLMKKTIAINVVIILLFYFLLVMAGGKHIFS
jgi:hypothetical protein